jgi:APA family basic amino acid/polyamine antiporter
MLTNSTTLVSILGISFITATLVALPAGFIVVTRVLFAWSFDRLIPAKVNEVNARTHAPLIANATVLTITLAFLAFVIYGTSRFVGIFFSGAMAQCLSFMILASTLIVLPFRHRTFSDASPIKRSIGPIPILSLVGVLALAAYIFFFVLLATKDALGANTHVGWVATFIIAGAAIVFYPIVYLVNRWRGVDLGLAYRGLPPE